MKIPKDPPNYKKILENQENQIELGKYLDRDDVKDFINHINYKYLYWEEFKHRKFPKDTKQELLWAFIKVNRNLNIRKLKISNIENFEFKYIIPDLIMQKLHEFDMELGGSLIGHSIIPEKDRDKYLINSIMEEAIASSQIEGAVTTRKVAKEMLRKSRKPRNKSERMIINNYRTINRLKAMKDKKLNKKMILDIHASMTKDTLDDSQYEGEFRETNDVYVTNGVTGKVYYKPPDYNHLTKLIDDFCKFANKEDPNGFIHPIIKACISHFLMGYIHPFEDGNGRTARTIFYWYLINHGYWLIEFMSISRIIIKSPSQYARAYLYTEKDENDLTYFIKYQCRTLDLALIDLKEYIKQEIKEKEMIYDLRKIEGINSRQSYILKKFSDDPNKIYTINEIMNIFDVVYQTARTDLLVLVKLGFLENKREGKKKLLFYKSKNFNELIKKYLR